MKCQPNRSFPHALENLLGARCSRTKAAIAVKGFKFSERFMQHPGNDSRILRPRAANLKLRNQRLLSATAVRALRSSSFDCRRSRQFHPLVKLSERQLALRPMPLLAAAHFFPRGGENN